MVVQFRRFGKTYRVQSSRIKQSSWAAWSLKMGLICCSETSITNCQPTLCKIPKERSTHSHGGGSQELHRPSKWLCVSVRYQWMCIITRMYHQACISSRVYIIMRVYHAYVSSGVYIITRLYHHAFISSRVCIITRVYHHACISSRVFIIRRVYH